jgi:ATP-dependent RNA helicase SUPV3L1/SUV3
MLKLVRPPVTALLGPTNTGKTHLALERMLQHRSGIMGFPLRLLARENYDRIAALRGPEAVALVTGEERIVPRQASYFICTVEAMPKDLQADFLGVDEVQLAADRERGHVFTDRILHARGRQETWLVGAETVRPLLRRLLPDVAFLSRPRLSTLRYAGPKRIDRLPRRSAVVAFSVADLYEVGERLRRRAGGCALVFGALSPRTRNAQVGLYQSGEVDYLVATDAIGMGLNLDIDHVVFTGLSKFDGQRPRALTPAEVAQIAGRAGRHVRDGTFGPTDALGEMDEGLVDAVESHRFRPLDSLFWRNPDLDFRSAAALVQSLEARPGSPELARTPEADDHRAFALLAGTPEIAERASSEGEVRLLWDVASVPDFRNVLTDAHTRLLAELFHHLAGPRGRLPEDWVAAQVADLDRTEGDTPTLLGRIASIRTWTFVSNRFGWLADPRHWQERTRAVEDRLSDALHERLTEQFVDRRAAILAQSDPADLVTEVTDSGEVLVQGLRAGVLLGFAFVPDASLRNGARGLVAAANRALRAGLRERVQAFADEDDEGLSLTSSGQVLWRGAAVARLLPGDRALDPQVDPLPSDLLDPPLREKVRRRLAEWLARHLEGTLGPLLRLRDGVSKGAPRGLAFVLGENLGSVARSRVAAQVAALTNAERAELSRRGVTLGRQAVFLPALLKPAALRLRALLWSLGHGRAPETDGRPAVALDPAYSWADYEACGYQPVARMAVRVDVLHRIAVNLTRLSDRGPFGFPPELPTLLGQDREAAADVLGALGYALRGDVFVARRRERPGSTERRRA